MCTSSQFSEKPGCGTLPTFGAFIFKGLEAVVNRWTDVKQAQMWCADDNGRNKWKNEVQEDWKKTRSYSKQKSEELIDLEQIATGALAYNGFSDDLTFRIPDYNDTPQELKGKKLLLSHIKYY